MILDTVIREETCDWHSRGGSATYDIMHNGGYVTVDSVTGESQPDSLVDDSEP